MDNLFHKQDAKEVITIKEDEHHSYMVEEHSDNCEARIS